MIGFSEFLDYYYAIITYKFADGHTEEIEVTDEVAAAFEQLEKYEKKVERKKPVGIFPMTNFWIADLNFLTRAKTF